MKNRTTKELVAMENMLFDKVWYHRYKMSQCRAYEGAKLKQYKAQLDGKKKVKSDYKEEAHVGYPAAQKIIQRYGEENLGPYTDFELGVLNGKLAAIRWAMGDEEDNYDS
jgi:hypothetical protein